MKKFRISRTELPVVWLGTGVFAGAGGFGELAARYHERFYGDVDFMVEIMSRAAELGWGIEALAMENIVRAIDRLKDSYPDVSTAYTCGMTDFVTEVNSALKRNPELVFLHARLTDTSSREEIDLYFRRIAESWVFPAAVTHEPLEAAAKLEDTECRAIAVPPDERGAALENAVGTVHNYGMAYIARVMPIGDAKNIATGVHAAVRAGVDAMIIGVTAVEEIDVYMRWLDKMGFL